MGARWRGGKSHLRWEGDSQSALGARGWRCERRLIQSNRPSLDTIKSPEATSPELLLREAERKRCHFF